MEPSFVPFVTFCVSFFMLVFGRALYQYQKCGIFGINYNFPATAFLGSILFGLGYQAYVFGFQDVRMFKSDATFITGYVLFLFSSITTWIAQVQLGASWRVSIPKNDEEKPGLVTSKAYEYTRNPIFTSLLLTVTAFVIMLPTWLSIGIGILTFAGIRAQIAEEEKWLLKSYGKEYEDYKNRVPRFFSLLKR